MVSNKTRKSSKKQESTWLSEHPWMGIFILLFLYVIFLLLPGLLYAIFVNQTFYNTHLYVAHLIDFFGVAILFIIIVPFALGLPNGRKFVGYTKGIRVVNIKPAFRTVVLGFITAIVTLACMLFATYLTTLTSTTGQVIFDPNLLINPSTINIYTSLRPGIWEEVAFRGIILVLLLKIYSERTSIFINGILFGAFHLVNIFGAFLGLIVFGTEFNNEMIFQVLFQVIYTTFFGIFLAYLFIKANSLIPCIIVHYLVDGFSTLVTSASNVNVWLFLMFVTVLGIGILPMKLNILIVRSSCYTWPQPFDEKVSLFDTYLARKNHKK
ncbi:MAG: CPBP family intramembrane metalloprotease [Candidatus Heimdallarchaeota archaeon]